MIKQVSSKKPLALVALVAVLVSAQLAFAVDPDARLQTWQSSFEQFVEGHPDLSAEESAVVWEALDIAAPEFFANSIDAKQRNVLTEYLSVLRNTLSCADYDEIRADLSGMKDWLDANNVAVVASDCNCTQVSTEPTDDETIPDSGVNGPVIAGTGCAVGWECDNSISCTSHTGTSHNGRCKKK